MKTASAHRPWRFAATLTSLGLAAAGLGWVGPTAAFEVKPEARLHLDYARHDADSRSLEDDGIVRRATLGLDGKFGTAWSFEVAYELASNGRFDPGDGKFKDVVLDYGGWSPGDLVIGQSKIPFGLDELTSSNDTIFIERALPVDAFAPSRRLGLAFSRQQGGYTLVAMAFGSSIDGDDRGRGLAARATAAPVRTADTVLHLGAAIAVEAPRGKVDFDAAPESRVADVDLVNTGGIDDVERIRRLGLEAAWRHGPMTVQGEWLRAGVRRSGGQPDAVFSGWYIAGSWVLTGEMRPYKHGRFKGIEPSLPGGAWELTARLSRIDLDSAEVRGGRERNLTLGLNYHLNERLRIMLNHVRVRSERRGRFDDPSLWLLRLQLTL